MWSFLKQWVPTGVSPEAQCVPHSSVWWTLESPGLLGPTLPSLLGLAQHHGAVLVKLWLVQGTRALPQADKASLSVASVTVGFLSLA